MQRSTLLNQDNIFSGIEIFSLCPDPSNAPTIYMSGAEHFT